jgi:hypothetical protein
MRYGRKTSNVDGKNETTFINLQDELLPPVVTASSGIIEGYYMKVVSGRKVYAFEGIPYAEPPTGNNRFRVLFMNE